MHYGICSWVGLCPLGAHPTLARFPWPLSRRGEREDPRLPLPVSPFSPSPHQSPSPPRLLLTSLHLSLFQFLVYFVYFVLLSIAYFLAAALGSLSHFQRDRHQPLPLAQELSSPLKEKDIQALNLQDGALSNLQLEATPLAPEDSTWAKGPVLSELPDSRELPEAKA